MENAAGLEQVFYAGSVIVGDRRQGLITYQENNRSGAQPNRSSRFSARSRNVAVKPASETQYKVLKPGDRFLGYVVAAIEPDKIVFEKGGEKVEKFLYDQNKKRPEVSETPRATPSPAQAGVNGTVTAPPANISPNVGSGPGGSSPPSPTPFRRSIRSRRLPRYNPASRLPNLPVPSAPTASPNN